MTHRSIAWTEENMSSSKCRLQSYCRVPKRKDETSLSCRHSGVAKHDVVIDVGVDKIERRVGRKRRRPRLNCRNLFLICKSISFQRFLCFVVGEFNMKQSSVLSLPTNP